MRVPLKGLLTPFFFGRGLSDMGSPIMDVLAHAASTVYHYDGHIPDSLLWQRISQEDDPRSQTEATARTRATEE